MKVQMEEQPPEEIQPTEQNNILKNVNPITILLIGIVIGVVFVSMRPIVIQRG